MSEQYTRRQNWRSFLCDTAEINKQEAIALQCDSLTVERDDDAGTFIITHEEIGCIYTALQVGPDLEPESGCWLARASCTRYDITQEEDEPETIATDETRSYGPRGWE